MMIPFNKPYLCGNETKYIQEAVSSGKISGNGMYTQKCQDFFQRRYGFRNVLLTTSCTDALEMAALLIDIQPGDEVIMPSYTFVSTANAFVLRGAVIRFADSESIRPNMDADLVEPLINQKTRAIIVVHYAGMACDMQKIMSLAETYDLYVIEDAAQAIDSYYRDRPLGSVGHLAAFSFHETKNIISGEGGMLAINDEKFSGRAEILWEKGTNRSAFFRGEVDKYGWVDVGSSFLPSEITAAFLFAQLENLEDIQQRRLFLWDTYYQELMPLEKKGYFSLPDIPVYATNNAHMFYMVFSDAGKREEFMKFMKEREILTVFHYLSLHKSLYYQKKHDGRALLNSDHFSDCLVRLPMYYELDQQDYIIKSIHHFFTHTSC